MIHTPVLIAGGGPVGLAVALELAYHGIASTVIEPRDLVEHGRPRAKTTSARTMELFRRTGVAADIKRSAAIGVDWSDEIRFCTTVTGTDVTWFSGVLGLDLADSPLTAEAAQQVTQPTVEDVLRERLATEPLVTLRFGQTVTSVDLSGDRPRVQATDAAGHAYETECEYVVGADGSRSAVRAALGAHYEGAPGGRPNVNITFRSRDLIDLVPSRRAIHHWVLNPDAPGVVGPLDLDGTWWAIATGLETIADESQAVAAVRGLVGADIDVEILATDPWQARLLLADSYGHGRAYLVGDAAHQNPPWGGHGFNTGVGDAVNLAWKLAAVLHGWAPVELLASYEAERRVIAQQTIELAAGNMRALSIDLSDAALMGDGPDADAAREAAASAIQIAKRSEFYSLGLVLGYGYGPDAPAQAPSGDVYVPIAAPGNRLPHARNVGGDSLFDYLGPEFTVVGSGLNAQHLMRALSERGIPVTLLDPTAAGFAASDVPALALVRPDQHLAWVASDGRLPDELDPIITAALRGFTPAATAAL